MKKKDELLTMYNKENIIKWFNNYKTYCYNINDIIQIKHEFIVGEYKEIKHITKNKEIQKKLLNQIKNTIL